MPTGCSEDTYAFYRVLRAGYAIAYEPAAFVWHRHRADMRSLRRQIYSYAKGHTAYHLTLSAVMGTVAAQYVCCSTCRRSTAGAQKSDCWVAASTRCASSSSKSSERWPDPSP